jgi:hypothetical protein
MASTIVWRRLPIGGRRRRPAYSWSIGVSRSVSSTMRSEIAEPYRPTVGSAAAVHDGSWYPPGNPAKVAQGVLRVSDMGDPPLRLLLAAQRRRPRPPSIAVR